MSQDSERPETQAKRRNCSGSGQMQALSWAERLLESSQDPAALLHTILDEALSIAGETRGFVALVERQTGELVIRHTAGPGWTEEMRRRRIRVAGDEPQGITGHVAAVGKPFRTGNVAAVPQYLPFFDDVRSELAVPMLDREGHVVGVVNIESERLNAFTADQERLLQAVANLGAAAAALADHHARERALIELGKELGGRVDMQGVMERVVELAGQILRAEDASLFVREHERDLLVLAASEGVLKSQVGVAAYRWGEGLTGWVAEHAMPVRTDNVRDDARWKGVHPEFPWEQMGAFLAVPVVGREGTVGVLRVLRRKGPQSLPNPFSPEEEDLLMTLGSQVGVAIENARLLERVVDAERMAAWGEMSARSVHMLGNRLFALKGSLNELEYQLCPGHTNMDLCSNLVQDIKRGVFDLEGILQEFKDFVVATRLTLAPTDVNELIRRTVPEAIPRDSGVVLELELEESLPAALADGDKLSRCLRELTENAVSAQPEGGRVKVATRRASEQEAQGHCVAGGGPCVALDFADDGPGVPAAEKERIFKPFYSTRARGMGLGLAIVHSIIEAHGGEIVEVGVPGEGAHFVLYLPAASREGDTADVQDTDR